jgi:hypothetical protein
MGDSDSYRNCGKHFLFTDFQYPISHELTPFLRFAQDFPLSTS